MYKSLIAVNCSVPAVSRISSKQFYERRSKRPTGSRQLYLPIVVVVPVIPSPMAVGRPFNFKLLVLVRINEDLDRGIINTHILNSITQRQQRNATHCAVLHKTMLNSISWNYPPTSYVAWLSESFYHNILSPNWRTGNAFHYTPQLQVAIPRRFVVAQSSASSLRHRWHPSFFSHQLASSQCRNSPLQ